MSMIRVLATTSPQPAITRIQRGHCQVTRHRVVYVAAATCGSQGSCCKRDIVCAVTTTLTSAACNCAGNVLPRLSARRNIPAHAFGLKKYSSGTKSVSSTCHNEHTLASLGQAEVLGINNPPCDCPPGASNNTCDWPARNVHTGVFFPAPVGRGPSRFRSWAGFNWIPLSGKPSKEATERVVVGTEASGYVFPLHDAGFVSIGDSNIVNCIGNLAERQGQCAPVVGKGIAVTRDAEGLARSTPGKERRRFHLPIANTLRDRAHVADIRDIWPVMRKDC